MLPTTEVVAPLHRALFSGFSVSRTGDNQARMFLDTVSVALLFILPSGLGISMIAEPLTRLTLGLRWTEAVPVIEIIAAAAGVTIFSYISAAFLSANGRQKMTFWLFALSTLVRLPLLLWFVAVGGLVGGAVAVAASLVVEQLLFLWFTLPQIGASVRQLASRALRPALASLAMICAMAEMGMAWTSASGSGAERLIVDLGERCLTGATVYSVAIILMWCLAGRPEGGERSVFVTVSTWVCGLRADV